MRDKFVILSLAVVALNILGYYFFPWILWSLVFFGPIIVMGYIDFFQKRKAIRRNFPFLGRFRYWLELIRPEIYQYFIESNADGVPFNREERSLIYKRAKSVLDTLPFGTQKNVYEDGYEWLNHSLMPVHIENKDLRVTVGGPDCTQPYSCSIFNISAMSYGALSKQAILALNGGAKDGGFAHNTGEGGVSPYHLEPGGDLIWQIGTGYFGCRTDDGQFCQATFEKQAGNPQIKMIEIKLSQGAKPGHGGILPAEKLTPEIAKIRHVPMGKDVLSPPAHSAFSTPKELMHFIKELRVLSGGKPIGFKLCVGKRREFLAICKAMIETGVTPDFIVVDGGEGGTGAAPLEFSNHLGTPGVDALIFVHNSLVGYSLRDKIKIFATGKVSTGFGVVKRLALGADVIYSSRAMMMALGCIQALHCNTNHCPTGVATQDPNYTAGLVVSDKRKRVKTYHEETVHSAAELMEAMGIEDTNDLQPWHVMRRVSRTRIKHYGELFEFLKDGSLLHDDLPPSFVRACEAASADTFRHTSAAQQ